MMKSPAGRLILADNVAALMEAQYHDCENKPLTLAKEAGVSLSSVQRVLGAKTGATTDTIDKLAQTFKLQPYQLLIPYLNPRNPQAVKGFRLQNGLLKAS